MGDCFTAESTVDPWSLSACSISEIQIVFLGTLIGDESDFSGIYIGIYIWDDSSYIKQIGIYPWFFFFIF